ncbi:MAG: helix-turn-helix domain-containing protein [Hyphomicrobium sp.]
MDHIGLTVETRARNIEFIRADVVAQHGFTQVPNFLFKNSGLSMGAIVVYSKFLSYAWHNDFCFPGQQRLADDLGMGVASINRFVKELEDATLIEIERRGQGKTNVYKIAFVVTKKSKAQRKS